MKQIYPYWLFLWTILVFTHSSASAQVYVKSDAAGANNGTSWQNAYADLATALDNAPAGAALWIAAGTYKPGSGTPDSSSTFRIAKNLSLYGGFAGNESSLSARNPAANVTILSGDINGDDVSENFTTNKSDNVQHVVYVDSLIGSAVIIDGFSIIGGHTSNFGSVAAYFRTGGGLYALSPVNVNQCSFYNNFGRSGGCIALVAGASGSSVSNSSFTKNFGSSQSAGILISGISNVAVQSCTFQDNRATRGVFYALNSSDVTVDGCQFRFNENPDGASAGFYNFGSLNVQLLNSQFEGNVALNSGALYYDNTDLPGLTNPQNFVVSNCLFLNNSTTGGIGGALRNRNGSYTLENCTFEGNTATGSGGQIRNDTDGDQVVYKNCSFIKGTSGGWGGAHTCYGLGNYQIEDCLYEENTTTNLGGAMNCGFKAVVTIDGCTFNGNTSLNSAGGAIALQNDSTTVFLLNSELSTNSANSSGGAIFTGASTSSSIVVAENCQFWGNETITGVGGAINVAENGDDDIGFLELNNCIFGLNSAPAQGGAVNMTDCDAIITSSLFFSNIANDIGTGGAISNNTTDSNQVEVAILNTTFADNFGALAAGVANWTGTLEAFSDMLIQNCIFRHNGAINYAVEAGIPNLISNGGNLSDDSSMEAWLLHPKDIQLEDPEFVDPDDFDYNLKLSSACIDAGVDDGAPTLDLAGNPRINAVDIGAYENQDVVNVREQILENNGLLALSPNPAATPAVNLCLQNEWTGELTVRIFDSTGKLVRTAALVKQGDLLETGLSLEGLRTGIYQVVVSNGSLALTTRLLRV